MSPLNIYIGFIEIVYKAVEVILLCSCLKSKWNKIATFFSIWIPTSIIQVISAINNFEYTSLSLLMFAVFIGMGLLLFENKIQERLIVSLSLVMICALGSMGYFSFANSRHLFNYFSDDKIGTLIALLIICGLETLFTLIWQKEVKSLTISGKDLVAFTMLPVSQILICLALQFLNNIVTHSETGAQESDSVDISMLFLFIGTAVFMVTDWLTYCALIRISNSTKETERLKTIKIQEEMNFEHYKLLQENSEKVHKIRHDIANVIEIAGKLSISGEEDNIETARNMFSELNILFNDIDQDNYCNNKLINIILCSYSSKCKKEGIKTNFQASVPDELSISETDICRIFTNLLDNAIYAVKQIDNPEIEVRTWIESGYLYIKVVNQYREESAPKEGIHGYGTKILKDIANQHEGSLITEKSDNIFSSLIALKII